MSDSPRTDAGLEYDDTTVDGVKEFARRLEGGLNAAQQRIKRLEEAGNEAICPLEYASRVRIWNEAKEAKP